MLRPVKDILSYARAPKLAKSSFQIEALLEDALRFVEEPVEEKEIRVTASFAELAPIEVDGDQLRQAFLNILLNATEAVGQRGSYAGPALRWLAGRRQCHAARRSDGRFDARGALGGHVGTDTRAAAAATIDDPRSVRECPCCAIGESPG